MNERSESRRRTSAPADDQPTYTQADIEHPWWCRSKTWCEVHVTEDARWIHGDHFEAVGTMCTMRGDKAAVQLTCEHGAAYHTRIALRVGSHDEEGWSDGLVMEPEEAELLARLILDTVARHPASLRASR